MAQGFDMNALFQQAQAMQEQLRRTQEELAKREVQGTAGGGMVIVTATGAGEISRVQIDRNVNRSPLFQASLVLQNVDIGAPDLGGARLQPLDAKGKSEFVGRAEGSTKKNAEQDAARQVLEYLASLPELPEVRISRKGRT